DQRRQFERARAQARGRGVHHVRQIVRRPRSEDGIPTHRPRQAGARALPRSHGSVDSRDAGALTWMLFFAGKLYETKYFFPRRHRHGRQRPLGHAPGCGITALTLYAFSSDNWSRPAAEVSTLMRLFARHLRTEAAELAAQGVKLTIIGRRDRLPHSLVTAIAAAEQSTAGGTRLDLRIAVDYSGRAAIQSGQL